MSDRKTEIDILEERTSGHPHDVTERLPTGLAGTAVPEDFTIPSCGIEDVDRSVFSLFNKVAQFTYKGRDGVVHPVPVIFAGGERFGMLKNKQPVRDSNGVFILPLISITRGDIDQSEEAGGMRGLGQDTGDLVVKVRLDKSDRRYQKVRNKLRLLNQPDIASPASGSSTVGTRREVGSRQWDAYRGEVLAPDLGDNIVEVITVPFPEFFSVKYEITFWSQYQQQMVSLLEQMMSAYHAQGNQFKLETPKGYWFVGFMDDSISPDNNFQDYADEERIIKYTVGMKTSGYLVAAQHEGQRSPFRRYLSAPTIEFGVQESNVGLEDPHLRGPGTGDPSKFTLSDVEELDKTGAPALGRNHSPVGAAELVENPFTGETERRFLRVKTRYQRQGETVLVPVDGDLDLLLEDP